MVLLMAGHEFVSPCTTKPLEDAGRVTTPEGCDLVLWRRDDFFQIRLNGLELMSSQVHGSEEALAELAHEALRDVEAPLLLIGGLGMGFTLRAALDHFCSETRIVVAEIFPEVVAWNRGPLADLASRPLEDARVSVFEGDVEEALDQSPFDAILLDVDNGPRAFTLEANARLYSARGIERLASALTPNGVLGVWSSDAEPEFEQRLERAGLWVRRQEVPACGRDGGPPHTIYLAGRSWSAG